MFIPKTQVINEPMTEAVITDEIVLNEVTIEEQLYKKPVLEQTINNEFNSLSTDQSVDEIIGEWYWSDYIMTISELEGEVMTQMETGFEILSTSEIVVIGMDETTHRLVVHQTLTYVEWGDEVETTPNPTVTTEIWIEDGVLNWSYDSEGNGRTSKWQRIH